MGVAVLAIAVVQILAEDIVLLDAQEVVKWVVR